MKKILCALFAAALFPAYVFAFGTQANSFAFTLGGGYYFFDGKREVENTGIPFGAIAYNFSNHWGLEGLLGIFNTNFKDSVNDPRQIDGFLLAIDGVYHFSPSYNIEPYVLAGVGVLGLNPNREDANDEGNINAGVGLQFFVDEVVSFRIEARDFYTIVGGKNDLFVDGAVSFALGLC